MHNLYQQTDATTKTHQTLSGKNRVTQMRERKKTWQKMSVRDQDRGVSQLLRCADYIFLIFSMSDSFQIYHNSRLRFTHAPLFSESHRCICRSQTWLLSVLLGGTLEGFLPFFFFLLSTETIVCDLEFL